MDPCKKVSISMAFSLGLSILAPIVVGGAQMEKLIFFFFFFGLRNQREARILNTGESAVILEEKEAEKKSLISVHNISN